jgi:hypothetical protein
MVSSRVGRAITYVRSKVETPAEQSQCQVLSPIQPRSMAKRMLCLGIAGIRHDAEERELWTESTYVDILCEHLI